MVDITICVSFKYILMGTSKRLTKGQKMQSPFESNTTKCMCVCVCYCGSFYSQLFNSFLKIGKLRYCMKFEIPKAKRSIRKTTFTHLLHVPHAIFTKIGDSFVLKHIKVVPCIKKLTFMGFKRGD